jgi:hypothetical protein
LYQAFPTLMTDKRSIEIMDSVLTGESTNQQTTLKMLTLIHETLVTLVDSSAKDSGKKTTADGPGAQQVTEQLQAPRLDLDFYNSACRHGPIDRRYRRVRRVWVSLSRKLQ